MRMAGITTTTYTNIVKIKFIVHVQCAVRKLQNVKVGTQIVRIGALQMRSVLKKCKIKYLTMNRISDIILSERGDRVNKRGNLKKFVAKVIEV